MAKLKVVRIKSKWIVRGGRWYYNALAIRAVRKPYYDPFFQDSGIGLRFVKGKKK
tara:strand:- start:60 stop:224 length:165 start_codon:yes stop_codon:yes gene_type:complete